MSARDDLLRGARQCLVDLGWGATTVRDIAGRAGVNHAAIGYHFGSRETLLTEALLAAVDDLAAEVAAAVAAGDGSPRARWAALTASFETHTDLWAAQVEAIAHARRSPVLRERLADGQGRAREGLGGSVPLAVLVGLAVQHLVDGGPLDEGSADEVVSVLGEQATTRPDRA